MYKFKHQTEVVLPEESSAFNRSNKWHQNIHYKHEDVNVYMDTVLDYTFQRMEAQASRLNGLVSLGGNSYFKWGPKLRGLVEQRYYNMWFSWSMEQQAVKYFEEEGWQVQAYDELDHIFGADLAVYKDGQLYFIHVQNEGAQRFWRKKSRMKVRGWQRNFDAPGHVVLNYDEQGLDFSVVEDWSCEFQEAKEEWLRWEEYLEGRQCP